MSDGTRAPVADWGAYKRLTPFLKPYRGALVVVLAISLVNELRLTDRDGRTPETEIPNTCSR